MLFIGLASLLGGFIVQMKSPDKGVNPAMLHGALTQLVTGVLLVGIASAGLVPGEEVDHAKIAVKLARRPGGDRRRTLTLTITWPHGCDLKDRTATEQMIGEKYLRRWGILVDDLQLFED